MATLRNLTRAAFIVALAAVAGAVGCYKPSIQDGGLRCTDAGLCPEGFRCAGDGTCRKNTGMTCAVDAATVAPLCTPESGTDCDPVCQSRCECGRCNLVGAALACVPAGNKPRGALCNAANDDCAPGNYCMKDCRDTIARCYRFCGRVSTRDAPACDGELCDIMLSDAAGNPTGLYVCEPPPASCSPVGDNADCGDPVLGCYVGPTRTPVCDCKGGATAGQECGPYNSCIPGFSCVAFGGALVGHCFKTCNRNSTECAPSSTCTALPSSDTFGYCPS